MFQTYKKYMFFLNGMEHMFTKYAEQSLAEYFIAFHPMSHILQTFYLPTSAEFRLCITSTISINTTRDKFTAICCDKGLFTPDLSNWTVIISIYLCQLGYVIS